MKLSQSSYENIVRSLHDGLYFVDRDRKIIYWNEAAEKISGFTASEIIGKSCADNFLTHIDGDDNNLCNGSCPLAITMQNGNLNEAEVYMHHKDGHRIPVSVRASTLRDNDGNIIGGIENGPIILSALP